MPSQLKKDWNWNLSGGVEMSEKRFEVILNEFDEVEYIMDKEMMEDRDFAEFMDFVELMAKNQSELAKENEQLRMENKKYEDLQKEISDFIIKKGLGSEIAKFLKG